MGKLRTQGARLTGMPSEVISNLDAALNILRNEHNLARRNITLLAPFQNQAIA